MLIAKLVEMLSKGDGTGLAQEFTKMSEGLSEGLKAVKGVSGGLAAGGKFAQGLNAPIPEAGPIAQPQAGLPVAGPANGAEVGGP